MLAKWLMVDYNWVMVTGTRLFFLLALLLAACGGQPAVPTRAIAAGLPQASATPNLPPTQDIRSIQPTAEIPTPVTVTPRPSATPAPVEAVINISVPRANEVLTLGGDFTARGLVEKEAEQTVWLSLVTNNGRTLAQVPAIITDAGWEAVLSLPINVSGLAQLRADLLDESGAVVAQHHVPVLLTLNTELADRYLVLYRPEIGDTAVGGYNIFFDGMALRPVANYVTISIWADECREQVAQQGFQMGSSSRPFYWQGFVVVPEELVGPACAVASFGEPGSENWREVAIPIEVLAEEDANARGVTIANPPPNDEVFAGEEIVLYGTAYNVASGPVTVSILMENGRIVGQTTTETDYWGYWEATMLLPVDVLGLAEITVTAGEDETFAESQTLVNVLPAPTPTPR